MPSYTNLIDSARRLMDDESDRRWADAKIQEWLIQGCYQVWGMLPWGVLTVDFMRVFDYTNATAGTGTPRMHIEIDSDIAFIVSVERKHTGKGVGPEDWVTCKQITPMEASLIGKESTLDPTHENPVWLWDSDYLVTTTHSIRVEPGDPAAGYTGNYLRVRGIIQPDDTGGASVPEMHEYLHASLPLFALSQHHMARQDIQAARLALSEFYTDVQQKVARLYGNIR